MNKKTLANLERFYTSSFLKGSKKNDYALFQEVHDLKLEKSETLAEHAYRACVLFKMQSPPTFY